jgi:hypothetical protein
MAHPDEPLPADDGDRRTPEPVTPKVPWLLTVNDRRFLRSLKIAADLRPEAVE